MNRIELQGRVGKIFNEITVPWPAVVFDLWISQENRPDGKLVLIISDRKLMRQARAFRPDMRIAVTGILVSSVIASSEAIWIEPFEMRVVDAPAVSAGRAV